jgi:hypothetical protein
LVAGELWDGESGALIGFTVCSAGLRDVNRGKVPRRDVDRQAAQDEMACFTDYLIEQAMQRHAEDGGRRRGELRSVDIDAGVADL